jgi:hypothetical protein
VRALIRLNFGVVNSDRHDGIAYPNPIAMIKIRFACVLQRNLARWRAEMIDWTIIDPPLP